ncbi:MAG: UDP-glucose 4-epimerase GalE [Pseudobdellovibrionaceae bacterium]
MRVLITGGAGYIGSHAVRETLAQGHQVEVLDDLSNGHREAVDPKAELIVGSTGNEELLLNILSHHRIDVVMHFAANIEVAESVADPEKYYQNNFVHSLCLLRAMRRAQVLRLVFSSTAAVYGTPKKVPIEETQERNPINPYGRSKMMTEMAIEDYSRAYGLGYTILRYFNVAGAHPDGSIGEDHHPETHLIPRILSVALNPQHPVKIYGTDYPTPDGTCLRDYVHVMDLVRAHVLAIENTQPGHGEVFNLGSEKGFSVREVIQACEQATAIKLPVREEGRRPGDPPALVASNHKARETLKWHPQHPEIQSIVAHAWQWHSLHPSGYQS